MSQSELPQEWFKPTEQTLNEQQSLIRPRLTYWQSAWLHLRKNKLAMFALLVLSAIFIFAILGPMFSPYQINGQVLQNQNMSPSMSHWFGTDDLGRDLLTRTAYGARISLFAGIMAAIIDLIIGIFYGAYSAYKGGKTDTVMMRIIEVLYGLPYLLIVILLLVTLGPSLFTIILALTVTGWINMARIVRGQVLQIKHHEYVLASQSFGATTWHIMRKHLLPNAMGAILVQMTLTIPSAIFAEAFLSFLGLGIQAPYASWGVMTSDALPVIVSGYWWQLFFPALFISITMYTFNTLGDGLQDALDPKLRKG